jgi:transglutaminase-like putative cysteine protease/tetratricopeptide (TPR) repeat protein
LIAALMSAHQSPHNPIEVVEMSRNRSLPHRGFYLVLTLLCFLMAGSPAAVAQTPAQTAREAQWNAYQLPAGKFTRVVDRQKGFSFRVPADWRQQPGPAGGTLFTRVADGTNLLTITEQIPEGIGAAAYVSSFLQGIRNEPIKPDSTVVRRVRSSGLEWREITYELVQPGGASVHQTFWATAVGPRAYGLAFSVKSDELEKTAPVFKRIISSVRIGAAGHWDEEYETLRAHFTNGEHSEVGEETEAALVAEALRSGRASIAAASDRIARLFAASPETAIDLITDADPQVRTAAIAALGKASHPKIADLMIWALADKDVFASSMAAQILATGGAGGAGGASGALSAIKNKLRVLAENPAALVRAGAAMGEQASRPLIEEMLRGDNPKEHMAALQLALISDKFELNLPFAKLFASSDPGIPYTIMALLERHPGAGAVEQLLKLLRTDNELWAVRVLGAIAPIEVEPELKKRGDEIDAWFVKNSITPIKRDQSRTRSRAGSRSRVKPPVSGIPAPPPPPPPPPPASPDSIPPTPPDSIAEWKRLPERYRLGFLRGELYNASDKIKFRDRWNQTRTEEDRERIKSELGSGSGASYIAWYQISRKEAASNSLAVNLDAVKLANLKDAPTSGETIFPKETFSYAMAPDFAATMDRLDSALSGVQLSTVRDQMAFAFVLKALKARLASQVGADSTGDAGKATGIDFKSPIAIASWFVPESKRRGATRSALTVRVTDRARFERLLATYQQELGDFDQFIRVSAGLARFAGMIPGAVPMLLAYTASGEARGALPTRARSGSIESKIPSLAPIVHVRLDNNLQLTTIIRPVISEFLGETRETICVAYFGDTAVVATSRGAIADLIAAGNSGETIARSAAFAKARSEKGEIVFFSRLDSLLDSLFDLAEMTEEKKEIGDFIKSFGIESGALQLTGNMWETLFKIGIADNDLLKSLVPFKVDQLAAPRELLPRSTILYASAMVDPPKLYGALKSLETGKKKDGATDGATGGSQRDKEIDADIEKLIIPNMQGEIAAALVSFDPLFNGARMPALALAVKLKNGDLAAAFRDKKLFANFTRLSDTTALGSPVAALGEEDEAPYITVTGDYLVLAESVETLRLFEAKEKLSSSRDYARSTRDTPGDLAVFATYNLESAAEEASKVLAGKSMQQELVFSNAIIHAFHSQRAYLAIDKDGLAGRLSVAFDREGRYSVGDLAKSAGEIDIANAMIEPKGLSVHDSTRVESMTLRVAGRAPGIGPRLRDDLAKFDFQRIESSSDSTVVVTASARRIPEKLTISLPVTGDEFKLFLKPTAQINSVDPRVIALARQIAGEDKDGRSVARKIGEWTYGNLKWKKVQSDAVETLASREADCLEHSELYVALARALGLPARVVSGAALSGGSFGAHAWVEVYLGKWVELDPTWGLMDHVDATHLRFDGDAFISYAMLNQLELEIASVRRTVADYQRDPIRLAREFSLDPTKSELAFDMSLAAEQALGPGRWAGLDAKQRAGVISAFEKTVKDICESWTIYSPERPRVLQSDVKTDRASVTLLRGEDLLRLTLAPRDGAWFIIEHELIDGALAEFADALLGALEPAGRRGLVYETSVDAAAKHLERLIAREGEKPELLLLKARVLETMKLREVLEAHNARAQEAKKETEAAKDGEGKAEAGKAEAAEPADGKDKAASVSSIDIYKEIAHRWPDFAPGRRALAGELFSSIYNEDAANPVAKDAERLLAELQAYARLAPYDPRPWRDMALAHERFKKLEDAASAFERAIELDREYLDHHKELVDFHLRHGHTDRAKSSFARMLKAGAGADEVFEYFMDDEEGYEPEYAASLESLLLAFTKEMEGSAVGWSLLAELQEAQKKAGAAIKSIHRALAIKPSAESFVYLSMLYRSERRYAESLNAADRAVKLEAESVTAHFERACSLARLGRKNEAMKALKRMFEIDPDTYFDTEEADLQPLSAIPEFRAMKEKVDKPGDTPK